MNLLFDSLGSECRAPDVKAALLRWLKPLDVSLRENAKVQELLVENGKVIGIVSFTDLVLHGLVEIDNNVG